MNNPVKPGIDMETVTLRLYTIRNIANLAAYCPENRTEADVLQDVADHIAKMICDLIEEIGV